MSESRASLPARDAVLDYWEGVSRCHHRETVTGLARDCLLCLRAITEGFHVSERTIEAYESATGATLELTACECAHWLLGRTCDELLYPCAPPPDLLSRNSVPGTWCFTRCGEPYSIVKHTVGLDAPGWRSVLDFAQRFGLRMRVLPHSWDGAGTTVAYELRPARRVAGD